LPSGSTISRSSPPIACESSPSTIRTTRTTTAEVAFEISQHRKHDYRNAADYLNDSKFETVSLQHEFGLFGGEAGVYLLELLERVKKPVVSTLHTVLAEPNDSQRAVFTRICDCSAALVVMAERARSILTDCYDVPQSGFA
jgi:hypothetical protein